MTATTELLEVRLRTDRGTVLIEPLGELDIATVPLLADAFDSLADDPQSTQRIVLDLRGLTFMDATGINELLHRNSEAQQNRHSLAVIRGGASINRLITLTAIDQRLAFVDGPEDLRPPLPPTLARPA
jgi:anti-sigma B factor antagonist